VLLPEPNVAGTTGDTPWIESHLLRLVAEARASAPGPFG